MINLAITGYCEDLDLNLNGGMFTVNGGQARDVDVDGAAITLTGLCDVDGLRLGYFQHASAAQACLIANAARIGKLHISGGGAGTVVLVTGDKVVASLVDIVTGSTDDGLELQGDDCTFGTVRVQQASGTAGAAVRYTVADRNSIGLLHADGDGWDHVIEADASSDYNLVAALHAPAFVGPKVEDLGNGNQFGQALPGRLEQYRGAVDTGIHDEFDDSALAAIWTAVAGSTGTANPYNTDADRNLYDLASKPSWLLLQVGAADDVQLRADYTLADGDSLVAKVALSLATIGLNGVLDGDDLHGGLALNDTDSAPEAGNSVVLGIEQDGDTFDVVWRTAAADVAERQAKYTLGSVVYLRVDRVGSTYYGWLSHDGEAWQQIGTGTAPAAAASNVWLFMGGSSAALSAANPMMQIDWLRPGGTAVDPW